MYSLLRPQGYRIKNDWIYASEADMLNIIMFGCTAKTWIESKVDKANEC